VHTFPLAHTRTEWKISSEKLNLIAAFVLATAMYLSVTIPTIRTVVTPIEGVDTHEDQIDALRVLSAGNTLIMVLLGGVLALQVRETLYGFVSESFPIFQRNILFIFEL
jgi:ER membrane protein SH3